MVGRRTSEEQLVVEARIRDLLSQEIGRIESRIGRFAGSADRDFDKVGRSSDRMARNVRQGTRSLTAYAAAARVAGAASAGAATGITALATAATAATAAIAAGTAGAIGIGLIGTNLLEAASEAEETRGKFEVVFDGIVDGADAASQRIKDEFGESTQSIEASLASLQDLFVPLGFESREALELSETITALGLDLASFNNLSFDEVSTALQSALVGNTETVRRFGVILNETNTQQEAYASGIAEFGAELTDLQKVQARLNIIIDRTQAAQGDAARTSESYANQMRRLNAVIDDTRARLGVELSEAIKQVIDDLGGVDRVAELVELGLGLAAEAAVGLIESLADIAREAQLTIDGMGGVDAAIDRASDTIDTFTGTVGPIVTFLKDLATLGVTGASGLVLLARVLAEEVRVEILETAAAGAALSSGLLDGIADIIEGYRGVADVITNVLIEAIALSLDGVEEFLKGAAVLANFAGFNDLAVEARTAAFAINGLAADIRDVDGADLNDALIADLREQADQFEAARKILDQEIEAGVTIDTDEIDQQLRDLQQRLLDFGTAANLDDLLGTNLEQTIRDNLGGDIEINPNFVIPEPPGLDELLDLDVGGPVEFDEPVELGLEYQVDETPKQFVDRLIGELGGTPTSVEIPVQVTTTGGGGSVDAPTGPTVEPVIPGEFAEDVVANQNLTQIQRLEFEIEDAQIAELTAQVEAANAALEAGTISGQEYNEILQQISETGVEAGGSLSEGFAAGVQDFADFARFELADAAQFAFDTGRAFSDSLGGALKGLARGTLEADEAFKQFASNFALRVADMALEAVALEATGALFGAIGLGGDDAPAEDEAAEASPAAQAIESSSATAEVTLIRGGQEAGNALVVAAEQAAQILASAVPGAPGAPGGPTDSEGVPIALDAAGGTTGAQNAAQAAAAGGAAAVGGENPIEVGGEALTDTADALSGSAVGLDAAGAGISAGGAILGSAASALGPVGPLLSAAASALIAAAASSSIGLAKGSTGVIGGLNLSPAGTAGIPKAQTGRIFRQRGLVELAELPGLVEAVVPLPDGRSIPVEFGDLSGLAAAASGPSGEEIAEMVRASLDAPTRGDTGRLGGSGGGGQLEFRGNASSEVRIDVGLSAPIQISVEGEPARRQVEEELLDDRFMRRFENTLTERARRGVNAGYLRTFEPSGGRRAR